MTAGNDFKRGMKQVRDVVDRVVGGAAEGSHDGSHINIARRTNIKVAKNVGHNGGTTFASATQNAPIVQSGSGASEEGAANGHPSE